MNPVALNLIQKERVCALSVILPNGSPHIAVVHYSREPDPIKIFIQTYPTVKTEAIQEKGGSAKAAVAIGLNEQDFVTLQMRGDIRIVSDEKELENIYKIHYAKNPEAKKYKSPTTIFLEFTPTWWRYTDFNTHPETVINCQ